MLFNSRFEKKRNSEKLFAILKSLLLCLFDTLFKQEFVVPFFFMWSLFLSIHKRQQKWQT